MNASILHNFIPLWAGGHEDWETKNGKVGRKERIGVEWNGLGAEGFNGVQRVPIR